MAVRPADPSSADYIGGDTLGNNLLSVSVSVSRGSIGSVRHVGGLNSLAGGSWDLVLDWSAGHLGDGVAVLNLNWDKLDLRVINTVLGGDFTASVLDGSLDRVSNSVSNWGNWSNMVSSVSSEKLRISFGISLGFTLAIMISSRCNSGNWGITKGVNNLLADLLVFNLFGFDNLSCANILCRWNTSLCDQNLDIGDTIGSRHHMASMVGCSQELRIGLSICVSSRGGISHGQKARQSKDLKFRTLVNVMREELI